MSLASKITLATATVFSIGIIVYVHHKQEVDRERLHEGVLRDIERQRLKKSPSLHDTQQINPINDLRNEVNT